MQRSMLAIPMILIALAVLFAWIPYMLIYPSCIKWQDTNLCYNVDPMGYWGWLGLAAIVAVICLKTAISMFKPRISDDSDNFH